MNGQDDPLAAHAKRQRVVDAQADFDEHDRDHGLNHDDLEKPHGRELYDAAAPNSFGMRRATKRLTSGALDPLRAVFHEGRGIVHGQHVGSGLHVPWVIGLSVLAVICLRRWPLSYGVFAVLTLAAAASSANLDSFERYGLSAFPLVMVAASLTASGRLERLLLTVSAAAMGGYAVLAFLNASVP